MSSYADAPSNLWWAVNCTNQLFSPHFPSASRTAWSIDLINTKCWIKRSRLSDCGADPDLPLLTDLVDKFSLFGPLMLCGDWGGVTTYELRGSLKILDRLLYYLFMDRDSTIKITFSIHAHIERDKCHFHRSHVLVRTEKVSELECAF